MSRFLKYNLVFIFIGVSILFLSVTSVLDFYGEKLRKEYTELSFLASDLIQSLNRIERNLVNMETGQRGYIITGDKEFLQPYTKSSSVIESEFFKFKELASRTGIISDSAVTSLYQLVNQRILILDDILELNRINGYEAASARIATGDGKRIMDEVRSRLNYFTELEIELLRTRSDELDTINLYFQILTQSGIFFSIAIIVVSAVMIRRRAKHNLELGARISSINFELSRAAENIKTKNHYISMAAHDLRNPLGAVMGYSEILLEDEEVLSTDHKEYVNVISQTAQHALRIVQDMLEIQKIDEGALAHNLELFNVSKTIDNILYMHSDHTRRKNILVEVDVLSNQDVFSDKTVFIQTLDNLLSNAIKFSPHGTKIQIIVNNLENHLVMEVIDQGQGIKESEIPMLFERFQKLSSRPTDGESSTGLGLSIVYDRLKQINGDIQCLSEFGHGTTFVVRIPLEHQPQA